MTTVFGFAPNDSPVVAQPPVLGPGPRVSVVIPVRNGASQLALALSSLASSKHDSFEVIVVDDGSTDDTRAVTKAGGARLIEVLDPRGPAAARNLGARAARGGIIVFVDADVCVHEETLVRFEHTLDNDPEVAAVFGSYDTQPRAGNMVSQYRNLLHHFVHQSSSESASTFWTGCGAIRRSVFLGVGGFDERYTRPCVEDIELGIRLRKSGHRIVLDRRTQVTHLKEWDLWGMLVTDIFNRGVPWTRLILREWSLPNDLNLKVNHRISAVLALGLLAAVAVLTWQHPPMLLFGTLSVAGVLWLDAWSVTRRVPDILRAMAVLLVIGGVIVGIKESPNLTGAILLMLLMLVSVNADAYAFFARERHPLFTMVVLPLHVLFLWYSMVAFAIGVFSHGYEAVSPRTARDGPLPGSLDDGSKT